MCIFVDSAIIAEYHKRSMLSDFDCSTDLRKLNSEKRDTTRSCTYPTSKLTARHGNTLSSSEHLRHTILSSGKLNRNLANKKRYTTKYAKVYAFMTMHCTIRDVY